MDSFPSRSSSPGVVEKLFQPLTIESLLSSKQATGNTFRYIVEGTATSAAAGVAEGGQKPGSTLGLSTVDEPIKKVATALTVSDELLSDAPQIQSYINGRIGLFVQIETERQLFRGVQGGNEVQGLLTSRNVPVFTGGTADDKSAQIFKAMNSMRGSRSSSPNGFAFTRRTGRSSGRQDTAASISVADRSSARTATRAWRQPPARSLPRSTKFGGNPCM